MTDNTNFAFSVVQVEILNVLAVAQENSVKIFYNAHVRLGVQVAARARSTYVQH